MTEEISAAEREVKTEASRIVMTEVVSLLAKRDDAVVIVGGWVPELQYPNQGHVGSMDVDIAVDARKLDKDHVYETVRNRLTKAGYRPKEGVPNVFFRDVEHSGETVEVKLDVITGEHDGPREQRSVVTIQGMPVPKLRGVDLGLDFFVTIEMEGKLPGGEEITRTVRIPTIAAFICMKAIAMQERLKDKDAYDIYFCLAHDPEGPESLGQACAKMGEVPIVQEAVERLRTDFSALERNGPTWAGRFAEAHGGDFEAVRRDTYERVGAFLEAYDAAG